MTRSTRLLKRLLLATTACVLVGNTSDAQQPQPFGEIGGQWMLVESLSDEFDGATLDTKKWENNPESWGVWSWQPENAYQKDGSIHLQMVQETHKRRNNTLFYKSGIARTHKTIRYGYFEARVRGCVRYPGACPAFWLHSKGPDNRYHAKDGQTVTYSEIDVIELQQCEWDFEANKYFDVHHIDCNLHATLLIDGKRQWIRPHTHPEMCKNGFDASWDPREEYHVYAVKNTKEQITWYIDGKEVDGKPNLYWHLPMHVTLSLGLRHPFVKYKDGTMQAVPEETTAAGFPTTMSVDYVRVWQDHQASGDVQKSSDTAATDMTRQQFVAMEKAKWAEHGWRWNQAKVESNFDEMDVNGDGIASGKERQAWYAKKKALMRE